MKSKITKIMGVALALVLAFSMGAAFLPSNTPAAPGEAEAATLAWSGVTIPSITNNVLVANDQDVGPVAISPNFASDNTVFAAVHDTDAALARPIVYKSTDGGHYWVATTSALGAAVGDYVVDLVVSPSYATDSTIFVATQTIGGGVNVGRVYRSTNGNISYGQLGVVTTVATEVITCMDVSPDYDGTGVVAVGVADAATGNYAADASSVQVWGLGAVLSWQSWGPTAATSAGLDISAMTFSPAYANDNTLLVVSSDAGAAAGDMATDNPYLRAIVGGVWDLLVIPTQINGAAAAGVVTDYSDPILAQAGTDVVAADVVVGSDYNAQVPTSRRAYVSIVSGTVTATTGNVYRITNVTAGTPLATAAGIQLSNLDYSGDFSGGTLIGGLWGAIAATSDVYRTTNPTDAVVNWYGVAGAENMPTGGALAAVNTTAWAVMSPDFATDSTVIVGTQGNSSAFGASTDGAISFNERGLIENAGANLNLLSDVALSPGYVSDSTIFMMTSNQDATAANDGSVWRTMNGGVYWERCFTQAFTTAGTGIITPSQEYASDSVVYVGDTGGTPVWYSADAGNSWSARNVAAGLGITIGQLAAPDASTVYAGDAASGNVAKSTNSGWTWPAAQMSNSGAGAVIDLEVDGSTVLVGGNTGTVRRSDDGGATYGLVASALTGGGNMYVAYNAADDILYTASNGLAAIYRSESSGSWIPLTIPVAVAGTYRIVAVNALVRADDGTVYLGDPTAWVTVTNDAVWRCIGPDTPEPSPGTTWQNVAGVTAAATTHAALSAVSGASNILAILQDPAGGVAYSRLFMYTDILSAGSSPPTLVSPADGTVLTGTTAAINNRFTATFPTSVTQLQIWYDSDSGFGNATSVNINAPAASTAVINMVGFEGLTVYWMARASAPFQGPWSEVWTIEFPVVTAVQAPVPQYPAGDDVMNIALEPVMNWSAFKYASGYEMQLATGSDFADLLVDLTGANALGNITSYKVTTPLSYDSTYYWRVRALKGTSSTYSDWSAIVGFTTMSEPVPPTPPVEITPPPAAPAEKPTPAYIWAIIGIGAVLVIVVVVLIVRTRRAV